MPRLSSRLAKLERQLGASGRGISFIIRRQLFWRENDVLCSAPAYASVLNRTGWYRVEYSEGETEAAFVARVNAKACGGD
jgi:hypothetical protein